MKPSTIKNDLAKLERLRGKVMETNNPRNKGWRGIEVGKLLGMPQDNKQRPDQFGHELKVAACTISNEGTLLPKEKRLQVTMANEQDLLDDDFEDSDVWRKLVRILFVGTSYDGKWARTATILFAKIYSFQDDSDAFVKLKQDYNRLKKTAKERGFENLSRSTPTPNGYLQIATKGGKNSITLAFYLTEKALKALANS